MATRKEVTTHTVTILQEDMEAFLQANLKNLDVTTAEIREPVVKDGRSIEVVFPISVDYLNSFLHIFIPDLPEQYKSEILFGNGNLIARITWNT